MTREIINFTILFVILALLQILLFNKIAIFDVAFPIIFIYFIIRLPLSTGLSLLFTLSFLTGFLIDIFSDTIGVNALACTLLASIKRPVFYAYIDKDDKSKGMTPSIKTMGFAAYSKYLLTMVAIYCLLSFTIEYFSFADVKELVVLVASSTLLTFLILIAIDCIIKPEK